MVTELTAFTNFHIKTTVFYKRWSGKRDSNPRPLPWQGNALPTELFPHNFQIIQCLKGYHVIRICQRVLDEFVASTW